MARYCGHIGFAVPTETSLGVWEDTIVPRKYYGDVVRHGYSWKQTANLNDDIVVTNTISIVADKFANEHLDAMKWIEFQNSKWRISSAEVEYPRITLTLGGVYNG